MIKQVRQLFTIRFWIGMTISAACVWLLLARIPLDETLPILTGGVYVWVVPAVIFQLLSILARSWRWQILLQSKPTLMTTVLAQGIGYLFTNILPLRLGEPARILAMSQQADIPIAETTATAVVERLFDLVTVIVLMICILPFTDIPAAYIQTGQVIGVLLVIAFTLLVASVYYPSFFAKIISVLLSPIPKLQEFALSLWSGIVDGLAIIKSPLALVKISATSLLTWGLSVLVYWAGIKVFLPTGTLIEATFMLVAIVIAITVPSSPGFIGVFQYVGERALVLPFGDKYTTSTALSIALITYLIYFISSTLVGILGTVKFGISIGQFLQWLNRDKHTPATIE